MYYNMTKGGAVNDIVSDRVAGLNKHITWHHISAIDASKWDSALLSGVTIIPFDNGDVWFVNLHEDCVWCNDCVVQQYPEQKKNRLTNKVRSNRDNLLEALDLYDKAVLVGDEKKSLWIFSRIRRKRQRKAFRDALLASKSSFHSAYDACSAANTWDHIPDAPEWLKPYIRG